MIIKDDQHFQKRSPLKVNHHNDTIKAIKNSKFLALLFNMVYTNDTKAFSWLWGGKTSKDRCILSVPHDCIRVEFLLCSPWVITVLIITLHLFVINFTSCNINKSPWTLPNKDWISITLAVDMYECEHKHDVSPVKIKLFSYAQAPKNGCIMCV